MVSKATQTDGLAPTSVSRSTQTKKARKDTSKKGHKTIGVQTSLDAETCGVSPSNKKRKVECQENLKENIEDEDTTTDSDLESDYDYVDDNDDSDYDPDNDYEDYSSDEDTQLESRKMEPFNDSSKPHREQKYIVFHDQLLVLLSMCHFCLSTEVSVSSVVIGSMLVAAMKCARCKSFWEWCSQPKIRAYAAGDILLSGAILFSGNLPKKALRLFKSVNIACQSRRSFFRHQNDHLHPVVTKIWNVEQSQLLQDVKDDGLLIGGDARCDSMGHSAKYVSYTAVDLERN